MLVNRVLVGTDGTDEASAAAGWAAMVARGHGADIEFVEAFQPRSAELPSDWARQYEQEARARITKWLGDQHFRNDLPVTVTRGAAEKVLVRRAKAISADLVVVGSKPREGVTDMALGSLVHQLAHHLACPVVTVPTIVTPIEPGWIIVGVDGSAASRTALRWAAALAEPLHARVCGVFSVDDASTTVAPDGTLGRDEPEARRKVRTALEHSDIDFVERAGGNPAETLAAEAAERHASLIAVAARRRGSLRGMLLGAVPDELIHEPPCPVAVLTHRFVEDRLAAQHAARDRRR